MTQEFNDNYNNRIVSAFIFEYYNILAVCFLKSSNSKYTMRLHDLENLEQKNEFVIYENNIINANQGSGIFFKAIYLLNEYIAFIFFKDGNNGKSLILKILKFKKEDNVYDFIEQISKDINSYDFATSIMTNEFYKINDEKFLFVSTISQAKLILMFFETYL